MTIRSVAGRLDGYGKSRFSIFAANPTVYDADFYSIQTVTVGAGGASSITFSSIPTTYQHLHIRMIGTTTSGGDIIQARLNSDSGNNYAWHVMGGNGSTGSSSGATSQPRFVLYGAQWGMSTTIPTAVIADILDYKATNKTKVIRVFSGMDANGNGEVNMAAGVWNSTAAVSTITISLISGTFPANTTAALYGVKA